MQHPPPSFLCRKKDVTGPLMFPPLARGKLTSMPMESDLTSLTQCLSSGLSCGCLFPSSFTLRNPQLTGILFGHEGTIWKWFSHYPQTFNREWTRNTEQIFIPFQPYICIFCSLINRASTLISRSKAQFCAPNGLRQQELQGFPWPALGCSLPWLCWLQLQQEQAPGSGKAHPSSAFPALGARGCSQHTLCPA